MTKTKLVVPPNAIDLHVGVRIRLRRTTLGVTQEQLGKRLGLTFQQVQKYERGANRVSASKLYEIATALRVPVSHFFDGLPDPGAEDGGEFPVGAEIYLFLNTGDGLELCRLLPKLTPVLRRQILSLVQTLSEPAG